MKLKLEMNLASKAHIILFLSPMEGRLIGSYETFSPSKLKNKGLLNNHLNPDML